MLTVKELKAALAHVNDDLRVVIHVEVEDGDCEARLTGQGTTPQETPT